MRGVLAGVLGAIFALHCATYCQGATQEEALNELEAFLVAKDVVGIGTIISDHPTGAPERTCAHTPPLSGSFHRMALAVSEVLSGYTSQPARVTLYVSNMLGDAVSQPGSE